MTRRVVYDDEARLLGLWATAVAVVLIVLILTIVAVTWAVGL